MLLPRAAPRNTTPVLERFPEYSFQISPNSVTASACKHSTCVRLYEHVYLMGKNLQPLVCLSGYKLFFFSSLWQSQYLKQYIIRKISLKIACPNYNEHDRNSSQCHNTKTTQANNKRHWIKCAEHVWLARKEKTDSQNKGQAFLVLHQHCCHDFTCKYARTFLLCLYRFISLLPSAAVYIMKDIFTPWQ